MSRPVGKLNKNAISVFEDRLPVFPIDLFDIKTAPSIAPLEVANRDIIFCRRPVLNFLNWVVF
jgi:hypothetical protein